VKLMSSLWKIAAHWKGAPESLSASRKWPWDALARRTMESLAGCAVAVLRVQRLLPVQLVFDPAAVAAGLVKNLEVIRVLVHLVGRLELPLVVLSLDLLLVVALGLCGLLVFFGGSHVECRA
jgi:hypothetical protein